MSSLRSPLLDVHHQGVQGSSTDRAALSSWTSHRSVNGNDNDNNSNSSDIDAEQRRVLHSGSVTDNGHNNEDIEEGVLYAANDSNWLGPPFEKAITPSHHAIPYVKGSALSSHWSLV
jgi:hypothetical protein